MKPKTLTGYPSIDKPWMKYYSEHDHDDSIVEESIFQRLERCNINRLDTIALELRTSANDYDEGNKITYGQYFYYIKECARSFSALGIVENEIVPLLLPNIPESRILIYALNIVGATAYPISPMISDNTLKRIFLENGIKTIVVFTSFCEKFRQSINNCGLTHVIYLDSFHNNQTPSYITKPTTINYDDFVSLGRKFVKPLQPYYQKDHIAAIIGTSGTTGTPKGVCLTDENLNASAFGQQISDHYREREVILDCLPQFIGYGISTMHGFGCIGCHNIIIPELITKEFPKLLCKIKPDAFPGGPVHYINLARSQEFANNQIPYVRTPFSGGATLNKDIERILNNCSEGYKENSKSIIRVRQGYGSTECCACATANVFGAYKFGSIGIPMKNVNVSIFKPGTDIECSYGEEGEICVSGPNVMKGYLNNLSETENVLKLHSDGQIWLHQADLGWCDSDGHFFITDRIKNIFMRAGFNVHPSKISEFIASLTGVKECTVVGVPHPDEQTVPVAFIVLDNDAFTSVDEAMAFYKQECIKNLNETDIPIDWYFVDNLPRNMGGKIDTQLLVQMCNVKYMG